MDKSNLYEIVEEMKERIGVEGTLDATDISNLAGVTKFGVWGINVTITKICKVVTTTN